MDYLNVAISTAVVSLLLGICGYFINLWIGSVNESIDKINDKVDGLRSSTTKLETTISTLRIGQENQHSRVEELVRKTQTKLEFNIESLQALKKEVNMHQQTIESYGEVFTSLRKLLAKKSQPPK